MTSNNKNLVVVTDSFKGEIFGENDIVLVNDVLDKLFVQNSF